MSAIRSVIEIEVKHNQTLFKVLWSLKKVEYYICPKLDNNTKKELKLSTDTLLKDSKCTFSLLHFLLLAPKP